MNNFGSAFQAQGLSWTVALCQADSDGDGRSNGDELGDPNCVWTIGNTPFRTTSITNPGVFNSFPSTNAPSRNPTVVNQTYSPTAPTSPSFSPTPLAGFAGTNSLLEGPWSLQNVYTAHAIIMAVMLGFFMPIGALMPVVLSRGEKNNDWFLYHKFILLFSVFGLAVGFFLAVGNFNRSANNDRTLTSTNHGALGVALFVLAIVQTLLGIFRPAAANVGTEKSQFRKLFEFIHPWLGRMIMVLIVAEMGLGYGLLSMYYPEGSSQYKFLNDWKYVHSIVLIALYVLINVYYKFLGGTSSAQSTNEAGAGVRDLEKNNRAAVHEKTSKWNVVDMP